MDKRSLRSRKVSQRMAVVDDTERKQVGLVLFLPFTAAAVSRRRCHSRIFVTGLNAGGGGSLGGFGER